VPTRGWGAVVDAARAARSLAEGLKEAKQILAVPGRAAHKIGIEPGAVSSNIENVDSLPTPSPAAFRGGGSFCPLPSSTTNTAPMSSPTRAAGSGALISSAVLAEPDL